MYSVLIVFKASDELMECLSGDEITNSELDVQLVGDRVRALGGSVKDRRLRIARSTWIRYIVRVNKRKLGIDVVAEGRNLGKRRILK